MSGKRYRAINFDLKISLLKKHYSNSNPGNAYRELKHYFMNNGFSHRQWSGYRSDKPMTDVEVMIYADKLLKRFPWIVQCANKFDITIVGKVYDLLDLHNQGLLGEVEKYHEKDDVEKIYKESSVDMKIQKAKKRIVISEKNITKSNQIINR